MRSLIVAAILCMVGSSLAAAQIDLSHEPARARPAKAARAKAALPKAAPATSLPSAPSTVPAKVAPAMEPIMQVHIVRSAEPGCEPSCAEWIAAQGRIDAGTPAQFKKVLKKLGDRRLPVLIDSAGGGVDPGLAVGRLMRARGLDVVVAKTEFTPCAANDAACRKAKSNGVLTGSPKAFPSKCASSCVFVLAGGKRRLMSQRTFVGVHQFTSLQSQVLRTYRIETRQAWGVPVKTRKILISEKLLATKMVQTSAHDEVYETVRKYFAEMGVGEDIMRLLMAAPNNGIHWLTRAELQATNMVTGWLDAEQLITGVVEPETVQAGNPAVSPASPLQPVTAGQIESQFDQPGKVFQAGPNASAQPAAAGTASTAAAPVR